jgi:uncharacterized protein (TIGR03435 family)
MSVRGSRRLAAFVGVVLACLPVVATVRAQTPPAAGTPSSPQFEVVSIKLHDPNDHMTRFQTSGDGFTATGAGLASLIQSAYLVDGIWNTDVPGLPSALKDARYDIRAKTDAETSALIKKLPPAERGAQHNAMMRAMLEDRFKLKAHTITVEAPVYAMVVAKGGFKIKPANPDDTYPNGIKGPDGSAKPGMMRMSRGELTAQGIGLDQLALNLQNMVHRKVLDQTGLKGKYDFTLKWNGDEAGAGSGAEGGPSIFTALPEQLGLKLESTRGPVTSVVVDHIEPPSEN